MMTIHHDSQATELPADVRRISQPVTNLEALTGADLAVLPPGVHLPDALEDNLLCHIILEKYYSYLIQYKRGLDLPSSLGERMNSSLARMHKWVPRPCQRVLMVVGVLTCRHNGCALVNGRPSRQDYWPVWAAGKKWCDRGGAVWPFLSKPSLVLEALEAAERHLAEYQANPTKEVWPKADAPTEANPDDPLQVLYVVKDARLLLAALKRVGAGKATDMYKWCKDSGALALHFFTSYDVLEFDDRPKGIVGKTTIKVNREWLGVPDGWELGLYPSGERK